MLGTGGTGPCLAPHPQTTPDLLQGGSSLAGRHVLPNLLHLLHEDLAILCHLN